MVYVQQWNENKSSNEEIFFLIKINFFDFCFRYREYFNRLKNMKQEIEHIQHVIEKDRLQMLKDFDEWWEERSEEAVCYTKIIKFLFNFCKFS